MAFTRDGDYVVATPSGDIDIANVHPLGAMLLEAVPDDARGLVLDLSVLRYVDSTGVHMLFDLVRRLASCRQRLALAVPDGSPVRTLVKIANLNEVAPVAGTVDQAIASLGAEVDWY